MAGDERNRPIPNPRRFLPDIGLGVPEWLQNFLVEVKGRVEGLYIDPDPPGLPENFTAETVNAGVILRWNPALKALRYKIYRGTTSNFVDATLIQVLFRIDNTSYLDVAEQVQGPTLYYWVRGESAGGVEGPLSRMQSVANPNLPSGGPMDLPFSSGILGDGRHGAISIVADTTATEPIPIYQLTSLNIAQGVTWSAYPGNPGGFVIAVKGRCTIAGTLSVMGRGGLGGAGATDSGGLSGEIGFNYGGSGGAGGAAPIHKGGYGGPVKGGTILGGPDYGQVPSSTSPGPTIQLQWDEESGAVTQGHLVSRSTYYLIGAARAPVAPLNPGVNGVNFTLASNAETFPAMWCFFRPQIFGWGSGGGSGGLDGGGTSGAGGNGGGFVVITCDEFEFPSTGIITAAGASAGAHSVGGGGGGGGGGAIVVGYRRLVTNLGTLVTAGGAGAAGSGGGAAGGGLGGNGGSGYSRVFDMRV